MAGKLGAGLPVGAGGSRSSAGGLTQHCKRRRQQHAALARGARLLMRTPKACSSSTVATCWSLCAVLSSSTSKTVERAPATVHSTSSRQHPERAQPWAHR
jgi:hypothetical protein